LEPAEECVTTHLPKWLAPKTDDAQAHHDCPFAHTAPLESRRGAQDRWVGFYPPARTENARSRVSSV